MAHRQTKKETKRQNKKSNSPQVINNDEVRKMLDKENLSKID